MSSCLLLMDLLYINERYDQVIQVMDLLVEKQSNLNDEKYPYACCILVLAACHKLVSLPDDLTTHFF